MARSVPGSRLAFVVDPEKAAGSGDHFDGLPLTRECAFIWRLTGDRPRVVARRFPIPVDKQHFESAAFSAINAAAGPPPVLYYDGPMRRRNPLLLMLAIPVAA